MYALKPGDYVREGEDPEAKLGGGRGRVWGDLSDLPRIELVD